MTHLKSGAKIRLTHGREKKIGKLSPIKGKLFLVIVGKFLVVGVKIHNLRISLFFLFFL